MKLTGGTSCACHRRRRKVGGKSWSRAHPETDSWATDFPKVYIIYIMLHVIANSYVEIKMVETIRACDIITNIIDLVFVQSDWTE